jgi:serine protease AprX
MKVRVLVTSLFLSLTFLLHVTPASAQSRKVVYFTNKNGTPYTLSNPSAYLGQRAIDRRNRHSIALDSSDLPVNPAYIESVRTAGAVTILGRSKWLNAVLIQTNDAAAIATINALPFVQQVEDLAFRVVAAPRPDKFRFEQPLPVPPGRTGSDTINYGAATGQIKLHQGDFLHRLGARGKGQLMAFFDAGFTGYLTNRFFDSARARNQFVASWDFYQNNSNVNEDHPHGLNCFSIVAANIPGTLVGSSPDANYILLRTEDAASEYVIEEYYWALGAEYADSAGVDVISSSLGYTTFDLPTQDHNYTQMNGNTTVITRMADLAAKKGILVVTSAGNEGNSSWRYISAPADGDSVLTVGAVNSSGMIAGFSGWGPTADRRIKPDVVSVGVGTLLSSTSGTVASGSGTSFSAPNMAGLATCLWQLFPEATNYELIKALRQSSDRYTTPQDQYGYGLPNIKTAFALLLKPHAQFSATVQNCSVQLDWTSKDYKGMRYELERKAPGETNYTRLADFPLGGTTFAKRSYTYNDEGASGTLQYRLVQVIDTTVAGYTALPIDSVSVTLPVDCTPTPPADGSNVQLYPNPVRTELKLKFLDAAPADNLQLVLYNSWGQQVRTHRFSKPGGVFVLQLPVADLKKGYYVVKVYSGKQEYMVKEMVKE